MRTTARLCLCALSILLPLVLGAAEPPTDTKSLATVLRPDLPKGWTLEIRGDRVIIERTKPVEVYNGIGLPYFKSEAELRRYVTPRIRKDQFVIALTFGNHITPAAVRAGRQNNLEAVDKARKDTRDPKLMPACAFWKVHPEYGYRELPSFDAGESSIYMDVSPYGTPWVFWSTSVKQECEAVLSIINKRLPAY